VPKKEGKQEAEENYLMRSFIIRRPSHVLYILLNHRFSKTYGTGGEDKYRNWW